jgi:SMC interacting uncharacterized protein involved in chromosome segregation
MAMSTEKVMEWVFKVATALVIPTIVWTLKMSNEIAVLREKVESQEKQIVTLMEVKDSVHAVETKSAVNSESIRGVGGQVLRISNTLDRIENHLRAGRP